MRIPLFLAAATAALGMAATANAAAMLFQFDEAGSSITITDQGSGWCLGCHVTPSLDTPFPALTINEGDTQGFDFADFDLRGLGGVSGVDVSATLAFTTPTVGPASTTGTASYFTIFGFVSGGHLTWNPIAPITTSDGSVFRVAFQDLSGLDVNTVTDKAYITVDHIAAGVPEPASWALMIGGFGMVGAMLRRRRAAMAAAA